MSDSTPSSPSGPDAPERLGPTALANALGTAGDDPDMLLFAFLDWCVSTGITPYDAQEEALTALLAGEHVVLTTPTGSGKSLVALGLQATTWARGGRTWYTAPIKALVNEKFFALCRELGAHNVGMLTGDAAVNPDAPVICATAEVLATTALRLGDDAGIDTVVMDEFHFYADRTRGWAWQVPLLEMRRTQFLLMSATLGDTRWLVEDLERRSGRPTTVVAGMQRPVPLEYQWCMSPLHETIEELLESDRAPVYVVHFTQADATERAQALTSLDLVTKDERRQIAEIVGGFRFDSPFGRKLSRFVRAGVGVHHAGLLPKYRRLVERLAATGLLKVICGTDTLGVGVNVPIRTVLFTQLCKYDGTRTRILSVRDFQQIAGRAGRKGFDDVGYVWCQAPPHEIENERALAKAGDDPKKRRKVVRKKPPEVGYVAWTDKTFAKLADGTPETLRSSFEVTPAMLLALLDRPGDGCAAVRSLLTDNHESRAARRTHVRRAIAIYRSLLAAEVLERLEWPDEQGRLVRVDLDLQTDFNLTRPLAAYVLDALAALDPAADGHTLDVVSIVEASLENPTVVLRRQQDKLRTQLLAELKAEGVEYEERVELVREVRWPEPLREFLYETFDLWRLRHPWVGSDNVRPKSVVRDLWEQGASFRDFVNYYGLEGSEGVLLRYLSDAYKALVQNVREDDKTEELYDLTDWLGAIVRGVDSSLLDEWERLQHPDAEPQPDDELESVYDVTRDRRAFRTMVRNTMFRWVQLLARHDTAGLSAELADDLAEAGAPAEHAQGLAQGQSAWGTDDLDAALARYLSDYAEIRTDADARGPRWFDLDDAAGPQALRWPVRQVLADPDGNGDWALSGTVDLARSRAEGRAVVLLESFAPADLF